MNSSKKCFVCMTFEGKTRLFSIFADKSKAAKEFHELTDVELKESTTPTLICQRCLLDLGNAVRSKRNRIRSTKKKRIEAKSAPPAGSQVPVRSEPPSTSTQLSLETVLKSIPKETTVTKKMVNKPRDLSTDISQIQIKDEVKPENVVEGSEVEIIRLIEVDDGWGNTSTIGFDYDIPRHEIVDFVSRNYGDVAFWTDQAD